MSDRMPPSPPRPPKFPGSGRPESPNWGVWVMVLLIVGVLAFGFFTPESFGLGPRKENLESFEAQYKAGRVVLNDPKAPVEVVLSENGSEGVIHALVYRKEIQPKVEMTPFALTYSMSLPDRDKPLLNELSGYRVVESPYRTEEGKNVSLIPEGAQKLSVPEFNRLSLEGRIAGGKDGIILAEDGNQNVLVGQIVTRIWPAATGDASVDKQRFERVEVPFTLEFQGDRVKQLLGPDTKFKRESGSWGGILLNLLPIVLILVILFFMFRAQSGGARGAMSFGKSRARLISPDKNKVTFKDVAGISEAKEEVWELVEFLRNPEKFRDLGATIPRGGALGMTMWLPSDDKMHHLRSEMLDQLVVAMGGRCAEQIVFGDVTSGATGDIKSATNLARRMVCEFGMSEKLGLIEYGEHQGEVYIARDLGTRSRNYSESTAELIDSEVRFLVDSAYERAMAILTENRDKLDILTEALMEFETLEGSQVMDILEYGEMKNPPARVTPPPMPSEVEEQLGKDDPGHYAKDEAEEPREDGAEEREEEEKQEQAERDPSSCNPADESGMDGGEKK